MSDLEYSASLDTSQILKQIKAIETAIDRQAKQAQADYEKVGKSAQLSGVQIGAVGGIVASVTTAFINLGQRAIQALVNIGKESVDLASNLETTEAIFTGIFQGNEDAAVGALARIRKESRELGVDLGETARAFLPFVESLDQLSKVGKISAALALSQPEQGELGARVALQEFLSGSAQSLVRRFEIPKNLGKELNEALATEGIEGGLKKLDDILTRMGRNIDQIGDTAQLSFGKADIARQQLQTAFGQPILDELKAQFDDLNVIVAENFDDYTLIADTFGRILAHIVDIVGSGLTDFLANLDTEQVIEIGETLFDIVENARLFAQVLSDTDTPIDLIDGIQTIAEGLNTALETAIKLSAIVKGELARQKAENEAAASLGPSAPRGTFGQINTALLGDEDRARIEAAGQEAFNKVIGETVKAMDEATKAKEDNRQATDDLRESQKQNTASAESEADAFLGDAAAARKAEEAKEAAADAQAKVDEARAKAEQDFKQDLLEADIKFERARTDALLDGQRKRLDAAKKNLEAIADIEKKNKQAVADSALDLTRDEQDIFTKHSREKIEQRKEEAQAIVDLEVDTGRKIADILKRSAIDLDEAAEKRDAVGYLRILKQRNQDIADAQKDAARQVEDTKLAGQRKREELKIQQQQELDDARLANARRLEDLQTSLDRELEAQATAFAREQEQIATNEQRKIDDLVTARERDREDAKRHYEEKLADLEISLAAELETIKKYNALLEEEAAKHAAAMAEAESKKPSKTGGKAAGFGETPDTIGGPKSTPSPKKPKYNPFPHKAFGGLVNRGQTYEVHPPELFTPSANGKIIPSNQLLLPSFTPKSVINNVNASRSNAPVYNFPVGDASLFDDPIFAAKLRNVLLNTIGDIL